ncbi:unnamed protein product [Anisakis simplex]|uniref:PH domain-containing protein n=1 Tax=Anisakis simplex TaxID=6269 RepID=A0A3P6PAH6_ANISI|nr:unnamed protein product [Anisakis simplex]
MITLRHKCGESLVMCVRGKNEIAKWRCAIWSIIQSDDHQLTSIAPSHALNRRSVSVSNATDASNFHLTPPTDPDEVDYWSQFSCALSLIADQMKAIFLLVNFY